MEWIAENHQLILLVVAGLLAIAGLVVKMTKTKKDDAVFKEVESFWKKLSKLLPRK